MEKKNYKLIKWKVFGVNTQTLIITFLSFCFCVQFSFGTDILIWPKEIKFNFEPGYSNDAIDIRIDGDDDIPVPEWIKDVRNENFAYIKGQSSRKIQVRFDSNCDGMHLIINLTITSGTSIGEICNYFVANYSKLDWITLTLDGSVPGSVGIRNFNWQWDIYAIPVNSGLCSATSINSTSHTYYTILAVPQEPMVEPWTDVLDYACDWAGGQSTESGVLSSLTTNLYNSGLNYNGGQSHYNPDTWPNPTKFTFDLTDFLVDWNVADCQDCGMFLSILSSSLGASLTQTRRIQGGFDTDSIDPLGSTYGWITIYWNFHHIGWRNNVYDSSIKLDQSSPYIPININIDNPYKIDLYNSGTWSPQSPFRLGQTDPYYNVPTEIQ